MISSHIAISGSSDGKQIEELVGNRVVEWTGEVRGSGRPWPTTRSKCQVRRARGGLKLNYVYLDEN